MLPGVEPLIREVSLVSGAYTAPCQPCFINFGASYPTNYDKPHAFNVVGNYKFSRRFSISANMVYSTGRPITYPASVYIQNGISVNWLSSELGRWQYSLIV